MFGFWGREPKMHELQRRVCARSGAKCHPVSPSSKVGIALQTCGQQPLNAVRQPGEGETCGWHIWWGDTLSDDPDFFQSMLVSELAEKCPAILPYLALPPGYRVQVGPDSDEVRFDATLLEARSFR